MLREAALFLFAHLKFQPMPGITVNLIDVATAAERTGYSRRALRYWAAEGRIDAQKVGGAWVFPETEIDHLDDPAADQKAAAT
jgi:excisionase family DNA binding protein